MVVGFWFLNPLRSGPVSLVLNFVLLTVVRCDSPRLERVKECFVYNWDERGLGGEGVWQTNEMSPRVISWKLCIPLFGCVFKFWTKGPLKAS
ncbi:unnamed protein product [Prunus armeniaca]|uniref:Secreted protein n=1 Tax=Prunus armeniaca TaxID=36596 RepID=A0A6J5TYX0_PRUAR|nr:unnamed protein product [Prunus armeniaca]